MQFHILFTDCDFFLSAKFCLFLSRQFAGSQNEKMAFAKLALLVALLLIISNCNSAEDVSSDGLLPSSNVCVNCSICPYTCQSQPPPSPSGYPSYGAPPPPVQSMPVPGTPGQANCPPTPAVQCCQQHPPPNPYGYFPYDNNSASVRSNSIFICIVLVFFFVLLL